jgi:hypothetical protein
MGSDVMRLGVGAGALWVALAGAALGGGASGALGADTPAAKAPPKTPVPVRAMGTDDAGGAGGDAKAAPAKKGGKKKKPKKGKPKPGTGDEPSDADAVKTDAADAAAAAGTEAQIDDGNLHKKQAPIGSKAGGRYVGELLVALFDFASGTDETSPEGGDTDTSTYKTLDIEAAYAVLLLDGKLGVGPAFSYSSRDSKLKQDVTDSEDPTTTTEQTYTVATSETGYGVLAKYYVLDVNKERIVPFVDLRLLILSGESAYGADNSTKTSGNTMGLGGGAHVFLAPHAALNAGLRYQIRTLKDTGDNGNSTTKTTAIGLTAGVSIFL